MRTLTGRTALVTGASRGIGAGIASSLAAQGAAVAVNYRQDGEAAGEVVDAIRARGGSAVAYQADVHDKTAVLAMLNNISHDLGHPDVLVSNAGTASRGRSIADSEFDEFQALLNVHALGPLGLLQALLPGLRAAERSDVVLISSAIVESTPGRCAPYTMAKAAAEALIRTLAREERENGLRANIVAPGLVATDMGTRLIRASQGRTMDEQSSHAPFGRVCTPEDVGAVVAALVAADVSYVTGQRIVVDGGGVDPVVA